MKIFKSKRFLFSMLVLLIGGVIFFFFYGFPWNLYKYKAESETYLEDKYQKEFVLKQISYDIFHNTYHSQAYEKGHPELQFYVGQNMRSKEITDAYDFEKANMEAQKEIAAILEEILPEYSKVNVELISLQPPELEINVWTNKTVDDNLKELVKKEIINSGYVAEQVYFDVEE